MGIMSLTPAVSGKDHIWGSVEAVIEFVEYGDFQCPYCGKAYPIIKRIKEELQQTVKVIFRNFPLSKIHPQAKGAAVAAEAAARQDKFWEMHDMLFENQKRLHNSALLEYASMIKLDLVPFQENLFNRELHNKVDDDFMSGVKSGVNTAPTFFINGILYDGYWDENHLVDYLKSYSR
jgi:protein-disulfide isomerase